MKYINKIKDNYLSTIGLIVIFTIAGYITTKVSNENFKMICKMFGVLVMMCFVPVIISIVECKKEPNMIILILNLLLVIVVFADIYCIIYSYNNIMYSFYINVSFKILFLQS